MFQPEGFFHASLGGVETIEYAMLLALLATSSSDALVRREIATPRSRLCETNLFDAVGGHNPQSFVPEAKVV